MKLCTTLQWMFSWELVWRAAALITALDLQLSTATGSMTTQGQDASGEDRDQVLRWIGEFLLVKLLRQCFHGT